MNKYQFRDGTFLDLSDFKGSWTVQDVESHFGKEISEKIWNETEQKILRKLAFKTKYKK